MVGVGPVEEAVVGLRLALQAEGSEVARRDRLRAALDDVRRSNASAGTQEEAWLAAKDDCARREARQLLARVTALLAAVDAADEEPRRLFAGAQRLLVDLEHHVQRLHDLAYDEVELELGESG
ncbi:MAG: hypothetical protein JWR20_1711 [Marmoricola sp.]|nr:hypothetical protein [Marmoricola sp.]